VIRFSLPCTLVMTNQLLASLLVTHRPKDGRSSSKSERAHQQVQFVTRTSFLGHQLLNTYRRGEGQRPAHIDMISTQTARSVGMKRNSALSELARGSAIGRVPSRLDRRRVRR
jgi:hypothetical protein